MNVFDKMSNTPDQEMQRRQAALFADILAVMNKYAGVEGRYVEMLDTTHLCLVTRYASADGIHDLTQVVSFDYAVRERK